MNSSIVIVGGGQAGAQAIDSLRRDGYTGRLTLIGDEPGLPYQRPPLSKKFLAGDMSADRLLFRHQTFYDQHDVELRLGVPAERLDTAAKRVHLADGGAVDYDRLLLCLGAGSRQLNISGAELPGVQYLRTQADVPPIRAAAQLAARVVVVGGGYIGLETAATCRTLGCHVTVLEMSDRVMNRVVSPPVSAHFETEHRRAGIDIQCNVRVVRLEGNGRVERVVRADGVTHAADLVIVGVGAVPNVALAQNAGLPCDNGILVDEYCRTPDAAIFAAGDCANHPSPHYGGRVRIESVDNAFEQAKAAALNMLDRATRHDRVPWFWSDQFADKLLIVGLSQGYDRQVLRGDPATRSFSMCYLKGNVICSVESVNQTKDYMAARKLIAERTPVDLARLADPGVAMKEAV
jgi:3-phenylpropionate/trans-cinnamate dioxygenase ferredoxin reductase subunit